MASFCGNAGAVGRLGSTNRAAGTTLNDERAATAATAAAATTIVGGQGSRRAGTGVEVDTRALGQTASCQRTRCTVERLERSLQKQREVGQHVVDYAASALRSRNEREQSVRATVLRAHPLENEVAQSRN